MAGGKAPGVSDMRLFQKEILGHQGVGATEDDPPLDNVFQFPDIARIVPGHEALHGHGTDPGDRLAVQGRILFQKMLAQQGDVAASVRQRGHVEMDDIEAVVKVFPEPPAGDLFIEHAVGGRDEPDVRPTDPVAPHRPVLAFLNQPQQLGLQNGAQITDFIQKKGAAMGVFDHAPLVFPGTGKRALDVTEQFAFQNIFGNHRAVQGDQGFVPAIAGRMQGLGHQPPFPCRWGR